jgi:hypothetical protein
MTMTSTVQPSGSLCDIPEAISKALEIVQTTIDVGNTLDVTSAVESAVSTYKANPENDLIPLLVIAITDAAAAARR